MNEQTKLILASYQVDNLLSLLKGNPYENYMCGKLYGIKYELERQLRLLTNPPQLSKISTNQTQE
jgi:hypothetical protein